MGRYDGRTLIYSEYMWALQSRLECFPFRSSSKSPDGYSKRKMKRLSRYVKEIKFTSLRYFCLRLCRFPNVLLCTRQHSWTELLSAVFDLRSHVRSVLSWWDCVRTAWRQPLVVITTLVAFRINDLSKERSSSTSLTNTHNTSRYHPFQSQSIIPESISNTLSHSQAEFVPAWWWMDWWLPPDRILT